MDRWIKSYFMVLLGVLLLAGSSVALAKSAGEIDAGVDDALKRFYKEVSTGKALAEKAVGMLVFPSILKAGFGIGGEYGEGALRVGGKTVDYYSTAGASIGWQLGAQSKSVVMLFLTQAALDKFRKSEGWKAGVDGSVAVLDAGVGEDVSTLSAKSPIVAFVFSNKGLMYNLTLEGSKFTKIKR